MSDLIPADQIEQIVGVPRHAKFHYGRAVSADQQVYLLHSAQCLETHPDLRDCHFSAALDKGITDTPHVVQRWAGKEDQPVIVAILPTGYLAPIKVVFPSGDHK